MKVLYIDCGMGAAGDMLTAALLELLPDPDGFIAEMNALGIPGVQMRRETSFQCGIRGTRVSVTVDGVAEESVDVPAHDHDHDHAHSHVHDHDHAHSHVHDHDHAHHRHGGLRDIRRVVEGLPLSASVRANVLAVYALIAEAESRAHGIQVEDVHFHEVGSMDAVADIAAVCLLMEKLAPQKVVASPVHVGCGHVRCAHGILPVPAPATAYILQGVPIYGGSVRGELCTPTGAALLKHFVTAFGDMPPMQTQAIGYGMGTKKFETANCVRAMLGESADAQEQIVELCCNVDDMTAEAIGFAMERLFDAGALEVFTLPAGMKKSRPGTLVHVLCRESDKERMIRAVFAQFTTIGVRETICKRHVLERNIASVQTSFGEIRRKDSVGYGVTRSKYEYEDLARIAREQGIGIAELLQRLWGEA